MINTKTVEQQASIYVYDLNNCAREFGFKSEEGWEIGLASDSEKKAIEKKYFPTVSVRALPEMLAELFHLVKKRLSQANSGNSMHSVNVDLNFQYLVAYNSKRLR